MYAEKNFSSKDIEYILKQEQSYYNKIYFLKGVLFGIGTVAICLTILANMFSIDIHTNIEEPKQEYTKVK